MVSAGPESKLRWWPRHRWRHGVTLIELLCVIAIIAILASMLLPTVNRAYRRTKGMAEEFEAEEIADLLRTQTRAYCAAVPKYRFETITDLAERCALNPKCRDWLKRPSTEFVPFSYLDKTNKIVLSVHVGRREAMLFAFSKGDLTITPEPR